MGMSLIIVLLVLAVAGAYFFLRRPKDSSDSRHKQTQAAADEQRIHGIRRSGHDKREEIRFEPEQNPRRTGSGRRVEDKLWDKKD